MFGERHANTWDLAEIRIQELLHNRPLGPQSPWQLTVVQSRQVSVKSSCFFLSHESINTCQWVKIPFRWGCRPIWVACKSTLSEEMLLPHSTLDSFQTYISTNSLPDAMNNMLNKSVYISLKVNENNIDRAWSYIPSRCTANTMVEPLPMPNFWLSWRQRESTIKYYQHLYIYYSSARCYTSCCIFTNSRSNESYVWKSHGTQPQMGW